MNNKKKLFQEIAFENVCKMSAISGLNVCMKNRW